MSAIQKGLHIIVRDSASLSWSFSLAEGMRDCLVRAFVARGKARGCLGGMSGGGGRGLRGRSEQSR